MTQRRLLTLAGYAALGPITGPLAAGAVRALAGGRPVLAGLYVLALSLVWIDLAGLAAWSAKILLP